MAIDEVLVTVAPGEVRAGFRAGGRLRRLVVDRGDDRPLIGDVRLGRVTRVVRGLNAAFVDIGGDREGLLDLSAAAAAVERVGEGDPVLVQVSREAFGGKGPKLSLRPTLAGRYLVLLPDETGVRCSRRVGTGEAAGRLRALADLLPREHHGWIVRAAALPASADGVAAEAGRLIDAWHRIRRGRASASSPANLWRRAPPALAAVLDEAGAETRRLVIDDARFAARVRAEAPDLGARIEIFTGREPLFSVAGVEEEIDAALAPVLTLPSGGVMTIAETAAAVAIDVDTGAAEQGGREPTALAVNLEAAEAVIHHVGLRELAGYILVDFVPMQRRENNARVLKRMRDGFASDRRDVHVGGFTRLGMVELTRRRLGPSLGEQLTEACPCCRGNGRVKSPRTVALEALRAVLTADAAEPGRAWTVEAPRPVVAALSAPLAQARRDAEARLGRALRLVEDAASAPDAFRLAAREGGRDRG